MLAPGADRHRGRADRATAASGWPATSARRRSSSVDELARTATGKLQKFKLRAPYWEGRERQVNFDVPANAGVAGGVGGGGRVCRLGGATSPSPTVDSVGVGRRSTTAAPSSDRLCCRLPPRTTTRGGSRRPGARPPPPRSPRPGATWSPRIAGDDAVPRPAPPTRRHHRRRCLSRLAGVPRRRLGDGALGPDYTDAARKVLGPAGWRRHDRRQGRPLDHRGSRGAEGPAGPDRPDTVVIMLGHNDAGTPSVFAPRVDSMLQTCRASSVCSD